MKPRLYSSDSIIPSEDIYHTAKKPRNIKKRYTPYWRSQRYEKSELSLKSPLISELYILKNGEYIPTINNTQLIAIPLIRDILWDVKKS